MNEGPSSSGGSMNEGPSSNNGRSNGKQVALILRDLGMPYNQ
jgi:hypothetical protein